MPFDLLMNIGMIKKQLCLILNEVLKSLTQRMVAQCRYDNNLSEILWSKFIVDERYANEQLGAYEGAFLCAKTFIGRRK